MKKFLRTNVFYINNLEQKNSGIKTRYMAYHDPELFFVVYLA